mgnify:CR=1 FL=1
MPVFDQRNSQCSTVINLVQTHADIHEFDWKRTTNRLERILKYREFSALVMPLAYEGARSTAIFELRKNDEIILAGNCDSISSAIVIIETYINIS